MQPTKTRKNIKIFDTSSQLRIVLYATVGIALLFLVVRSSSVDTFFIGRDLHERQYQISSPFSL